MNLTGRKNALSTLGIIIWWEKRRFIYNAVMVPAGIAGFCIAYITIPLIYILIAIFLNVVYSLSWIIEIAIINRLESDKATKVYCKVFFWGYLAYSAISVVLFSAFPVVFSWIL